MKVSKTALLVLGLGIFIIVFAALFFIYLGQTGEQEKLNESLATAQSLLPKLIAEREDMESQVTQWEGELAEVTSSLSKSEARYPKSVESIEYGETLFKMADECGLQIVELRATEPQDEDVKDTEVTYSVAIVEVVVRSSESTPSTAGEFETYIDEMVDRALEFIHIVATSQEFNVGAINMVSIEELQPPEEVGEDEEGPEATIQIEIYAFPR